MKKINIRIFLEHDVMVLENIFCDDSATDEQIEKVIRKELKEKKIPSKLQGFKVIDWVYSKHAYVTERTNPFFEAGIRGEYEEDLENV